MKLVVLGATGGTGLELLRQAMERGHSVTALVRSPEKLMALRERMIVRKGDLLNRTELERVIQGQDAVLSGFGPRVPVSQADAHLLEQFAVALVGAMTWRALNETAALLPSVDGSTDPRALAGFIAQAMLNVGLPAAEVLLVLAVADYAYQRWSFARSARKVERCGCAAIGS